jgi:hypothetical protein
MITGHMWLEYSQGPDSCGRGNEISVSTNDLKIWSVKMKHKNFCISLQLI